MLTRTRKTTSSTGNSIGGLPYLPARYTAEQLAAWKAQVAALPNMVVLPDPPRAVPGKRMELELEVYRNAVKVHHQQQMNAEAERIRTEPTAAEQYRARQRVKAIEQQLSQMQAQLDAAKAHPAYSD